MATPSLTVDMSQRIARHDVLTKRPRSEAAEANDLMIESAREFYPLRSFHVQYPCYRS
jgi:hypothetical protein